MFIVLLILIYLFIVREFGVIGGGALLAFAAASGGLSALTPLGAAGGEIGEFSSPIWQ